MNTSSFTPGFFGFMELLRFKRQTIKTSQPLCLKSPSILLKILWSLGILVFFLFQFWVECIPVVRAFSLHSVFSVHLFFFSPPHFGCSLPPLNTFYSLPLYCFKSAHFVSLASISLSPTHHANIPSLHTPKSSSSLSGFETRLFFLPVHQDTGVFHC